MRPRSIRSRTRQPRPRSFIAAALVAGLAGCGGDIVLNTPVPPSSADSTGGTGGTFQRATLALTIAVGGEDAALAERIGSPGGVLRQAAVTIQRIGSAGSELSETTDDAGRVEFGELVPGRYAVSVLRVLTMGEVAGLDSADADVNAFGAGGQVEVAAPATETVVGALAGRRGSLVISEVSGPELISPGGGVYPYAIFIQLYNNADTTIYLDGKVIGVDQTWHRNYPEPGPSCAKMAQWRNDPGGIWAKSFNAFPGTGSTYPLPPGRAVTVATDAIDHSQYFPSLPDLSGADFEFPGSSDADNPAVPNMVEVGLAEYFRLPPVGGHGLFFGHRLEIVVWVADTLTVSALQTGDLPVNSPRYVRIPRAKILDVITSGQTPSLEAAALYPLCPQLVNAVLDRQYASLFSWTAVMGMQRQLFATPPDGPKVLLRTKASANDFIAQTPPTPYEVP